MSESLAADDADDLEVEPEDGDTVDGVETADAVDPTGGDRVEVGESDDVELDHADELPADLDITGLVGPYEFPNNSKRKIASILYLAVGAICIWLGLTVESALVNGGLVVVGVGLLVFAVYSFVFAVSTAVEETDALVIAAKHLGFTPGHAAAQMSWYGWRSRPQWRILVYSDEQPQPLQRALVVVDAVTGEVREHVAEDNPEDWTEFA